jgi:hypothetical protein
MSSTQQITTKYQDFNVNDLTFTKFEENERSKAQNLAFPRYKETQRLMLQGPWIEMIAYGVPQLGEYYKTDKDRAFLKIPLDLSNPEIKEFYEKLESIDTMMNSKEFKNEHFGAKASKYKYAYPICRIPVEDEDDDDNDDKKKSKYPRPPYMKVKLDATWPETQVLTQVYTSIMKDGKREREKQEVSSVDEFAAIVRFRSKIRPILQPVKAWCEKKAKMGSNEMQYGVTFKLIKVEVEPSAGGNNLLSNYMNNDAFIDSDDEESAFQGKPTAAPIKTSPLPLVNKKKQESEDEEEEDNASNDEKEEENASEEEEEEEEEPEPEPPKKGKGSKASAAAAIKTSSKSSKK